MKVLCETQGTDEWEVARRGRLSASNMSCVLAGAGTKKREQYKQSIAWGLQGIPDFMDNDAPWFVAGRYYEDWARGWYSWNKNVDVRETGFVVHDEYTFLGCSPDGLIDPDGNLEIKYRTTLRTFKKHIAISYDKSVWPQVQCQMFVMNRTWTDYVNYWRSDDHELEQGHIKRLWRDDAFIHRTLLPACVKFWTEVQELL